MFMSHSSLFLSYHLYLLGVSPFSRFFVLVFYSLLCTLYFSPSIFVYYPFLYPLSVFLLLACFISLFNVFCLNLFLSSASYVCVHTLSLTGSVTGECLPQHLTQVLWDPTTFAWGFCFYNHVSIRWL